MGTSPITLIYFQNLRLVTVFDFFIVIDFRKNEKGDKGHEGKTKARDLTIPKFYDFFISSGSFGVLY